MAPESSEDEWEEVLETKQEEVKLSENVEVEIELPGAIKKRKKEDWEREQVEICIRREVKRFAKEVQIGMHKVNLLCLLTVGMRLNKLCNDSELKSFALSILPANVTNIKSKDLTVMSLTRLIKTVSGLFEMPENLLGYGLVMSDRLGNRIRRDFEKRKVSFKLDFVLIFLLCLRALGISSRLVMSFQPITLKALTQKQLENLNGIKKGSRDCKRPKIVKNSGSKKECLHDLPQVDGAADNISPRRTRSKSANIRNKLTVKTETGEELKAESRRQDDEIAKGTRGRKKMKKETVLATSTAANGPQIKVESAITCKQESENEENTRVNETPLTKPLPQSKTKRKLRTRAKKKISGSKDSVDDDEDDEFKPFKSSESETDFETEKKKSPKRQKTTELKDGNKETKVKKTMSRVQKNLKADKPKDQYYDEWLEVFSQQDKKWLSVDLFRGAVNHPELMEKYATPPLHYVVGFDNDGALKDITPRYASKWLTDTRKVRVGIVDKDWWKETLIPYKTTNTIQDNDENKEMQEKLLSQPIPSTISAFKNHPLFALSRHLLKYEAIYPPDAKPVGLIRGEEILPRSAVYTLHTRDKWLQEARCVLPGAKPYKMVASLWINMKLKQDMSTLSMPLFGIWQTEPFVPPVAKDGKVPRNQYGNVDLFKPSMIPVGCVQLRLAGLQKVARKLNIDIALAITGFDSHSGYPHPVTDGYIVCQEHEEILVAAWREDQLHAAEREKEKREQRVYGLWKQLIRGLLAQERVKRKYAKKGDQESTSISAASSTAWQAKRLQAAKSKGRARGKKKKDENLFPFEMDDQ